MTIVSRALRRLGAQALQLDPKRHFYGVSPWMPPAIISPYRSCALARYVGRGPSCVGSRLCSRLPRTVSKAQHPLLLLARNPAKLPCCSRLGAGPAPLAHRGPCATADTRGQVETSGISIWLTRNAADHEYGCRRLKRRCLAFGLRVEIEDLPFRNVYLLPIADKAGSTPEY